MTASTTDSAKWAALNSNIGSGVVGNPAAIEAALDNVRSVVDQHASEINAIGPTSGTWTPVLAGLTTPGSNTYSSQSGSYYKVGKMVVAQFNITLSAKDAAMAGALVITGLPFAPSSANFAPIFAQIENVALSAGYAQCSGFVTGSSIVLTQMGGTSGGWANITVGAVSNNTAFRGSIVYFTS